MANPWDNLPDAEDAAQEPAVAQEAPPWADLPDSQEHAFFDVPENAGPAPQGEQVLTPEEMSSGVQSTKAFGRGVAQGGTAGFGDELVGVVSSAIESAIQDPKGFVQSYLPRLVAPDDHTAQGALDDVTKTIGVTTSPLSHFLITTIAKLSKDKKFREQYEIARDMEREENAKAQEANPTAFGAGQLVGATASSAIIPGGAVATIPRAVGTGAVMGGVQALGETEDETLSGQAKDVAMGAAVGGAAGGVITAAVKPIKAGTERLGKLLTYLKTHGDEMVAERELAPLGITKSDMKELASDFDGQLEKLQEINKMVKDFEIPLHPNEARNTLKVTKDVKETIGKIIGQARSNTTVSSDDLLRLSDDISNKADELFGVNGSKLIESDRGRYNYFKEHADKIEDMATSRKTRPMKVGGRTFYGGEAQPRTMTLDEIRKMTKNLSDKITKFGQDPSVPDSDRRALRVVLNRFDTQQLERTAGSMDFGSERLNEVAKELIGSGGKSTYGQLSVVLDAVESNLQKRIAEGPAQTERAARSFIPAGIGGGAGVGAIVGGQRSDGDWTEIGKGALIGGAAGAVLGSRPVVREASHILNKKMINLLNWIQRPDNYDTADLFVKGMLGFTETGKKASSRVFYQLMKNKFPNEIEELEDSQQDINDRETKRQQDSAAKKMTRAVHTVPTGPAS